MSRAPAVRALRPARRDVPDALVLVCDSFVSRATDLAGRIEAIGYRVRSVATAAEARAALAAESFHLLIVAARLEDAGGPELCRSVAASGGPPLPTILMVDAGDEGAMREGQAAGVAEFLTVPVGARELGARIRRGLGLRLLHDALEEPGGDADAFASAGGRVLVAEDEKDLLRLMRKLLERSGYTVFTATDGREALALIERERPDMVLMDLRMPELDGISVCRTVKLHPELRDIPLIMVTGVDQEVGARESYKAGADDYLVKPVRPTELLVRMRTILRIQVLRSARTRRRSGARTEESEFEGRGDALEEWFAWYETFNGDPVLKDLRRRVGDAVGQYLEGLHEYKPEVLRDPSADPNLVRRIYGEMRELIKKRIELVLRDEPSATRAKLTPRSRALLIQDEVNDRFSFGPVQPLIDDPRITDILVNRFNEIHIELGGRLMRTAIVFESEEHLRRIMSVALRFAGKEINERHPFVETRLRDGSRVSATVPPLSIDGATLTIRKFVVKRLDLDDLLRAGTLSPEMAALMALFVRAGLNIIVSGATGAGKTTLLNLLGSCVPRDERIITVEDTAELQIRHRDIVPEMMGRREAGREPATERPALNMERFEARSSHIEGLDISIRDIIRLALRKRPDRIIVGEVRGGEALDMLNAMNTGHRGCLTTIHANNISDMILRLENMVLEANPSMPLPAAQRVIVAALSVAVQVIKFADNTRRITEITEIAGFDPEKGRVILRPLFAFRPGRPDPFVPVEPPTPRIRTLIEEYLMRTGRFAPDWDRPLPPEKAREVLKRHFRRHVDVHFEEYIMSGADSEEKRANRDEVAEWVVAEVYDSGHVVEFQTGKGETVALPYCDLVDNDFLLRLHADARRKAAGRLALPDDDLDLVVRDAVPDRNAWERIFPAEFRSARPGVEAPPGTGDGILPDDVRAAFFALVRNEANRLERSGAFSSFDPEAFVPRLTRLEAILPYLVIGEE
jgi:pilus assembly protein CpaF